MEGAATVAFGASLWRSLADGPAAAPFLEAAEVTGEIDLGAFHRPLSGSTGPIRLVHYRPLPAPAIILEPASSTSSKPVVASLESSGCHRGRPR